MCTYMHVQTYIDINISTNTQMYSFLCMYVYVNKYKYIHIQLCTCYKCAYIDMHTLHTYKSECICTGTDKLIHTYWYKYPYI